MLTVACFVWAAFRIFWQKPTAEPNPEIEGKKVPVLMQASMLVLALACILFGIYPGILYPVLNTATDSILRILGAG